MKKLEANTYVVALTSTSLLRVDTLALVPVGLITREVTLI